MKHKILITLLFISTSIYLSYQYVYQDRTDMVSKKTAYYLTSDRLFFQFTDNQNLANDTYLNQTIELKGKVNTISNGEIILSPGIICRLDSNFMQPKIHPSDSIKIKGRCIGFDDLFGEVKMDYVIINWE